MKKKAAGTIHRYDVTWGTDASFLDVKSFPPNERERAVRFYESMIGYEVLFFDTVIRTKPHKLK